MKAFKLIMIALLISGLVSSNAMAASTTGTAEAVIVKPLTIVVGNSSLNFGGFIAGAAGSISVGLFGSLSSSGVQTLTPATHSNGEFDVNGDPSRTFTTTIDPTVSLSNGTDTMSAALFALNSVFNTNGDGRVFVGGTLTVLGTESPGAYTGTFNVSVDY